MLYFDQWLNTQFFFERETLDLHIWVKVYKIWEKSKICDAWNLIFLLGSTVTTHQGTASWQR